MEARDPGGRREAPNGAPGGTIRRLPARGPSSSNSVARCRRVSCPFPPSSPRQSRVRKHIGVFFLFVQNAIKFCKSFGVGGAHKRKSSVGCVFSLKIPVQNLRLITPITTLDTKILIALKVNGASSKFRRPCFLKVYNAQHLNKRKKKLPTQGHYRNER